MRRAVLPWLVALGIAILAGAGAVVVLNATVFGPGAFVNVYLSALARGDASGALTLAGVTSSGVAPSGGAAHSSEEPLLQDGVLAGLRDIRQVSDRDHGGRGGHGDQHTITVAWTSPGGAGTTAFEVRRIGTRFGLFPEWGFAVSPTATVSLAVHSDARFTANGVQEVSATRSDRAVDYTVLVPGSYTFGHRSTYLRATPDAVLAGTVGETLSATVQPRANAAFVAAVTAKLRTQLAACATQSVLFPTGCSFGQAITDRVSGTPAWTILRDPVVTIEPGTEFGTWVVPSTAGTAHLKVAVTSLLDGRVTTFDQDVPFRLTALITLGAGDTITVAQQP